MRQWQIVQGKFVPRSPKVEKYYALGDDNSQLLSDIKSGRYRIIIANDSVGGTISDFQVQKRVLLDCLEDLFPNKSSFEK